MSLLRQALQGRVEGGADAVIPGSKDLLVKGNQVNLAESSRIEVTKTQRKAPAHQEKDLNIDRKNHRLSASEGHPRALNPVATP